jgi:hypothetical protein
MGLLVDRYVTSEGFDVSGLYVQVESIRILKVYGGGSYGCLYTSLAYKSFDDKMNGTRPVPIPQFLANAEGMLTADQFYDQTIFGYAYDALKANWINAGYTVQDYYPHPPTPTTYIYDCSGYNFRGFNCAGYDKDGYDKQGFNKEGWDREGYGRDGYNAEGYNRQGYDREGYDRQGYDMMGYDRQGYDRQGFDRQGCNREHLDKDGNPCPA